MGRLRARRDGAFRREAELAAALGELDKKRAAADGVEWEDIDKLALAVEEQRRSIAAGQAAQTVRDTRLAAIEGDLDALAQGLLPLPEEVEAFRGVLRAAGIPHDLLFEVVEVVDPVWTDALEGLLARHRLAVLPHDLEGWRRAAELARQHRYPHGVLAPDVRGQSQSDVDSPLGLIEIREPRYRALLARFLRPFRPREPELPLHPTRRETHLASDGFAVSRTEAWVATVDRRYLGRGALEASRLQLQQERRTLQAEADAWKTRESGHRAAVQTLEARVEAQRRLRAWQAVADEHALTHADHREAAEQLVGLDTALGEMETSLAALRLQERGTTSRRATAEAEATTTEGATRDAQARLQTAENARTAALAVLARLLALELPEPVDEVGRLVDEGLDVNALGELSRTLAAAVDRFAPDERDPLLPTNFTRQRDEVDAVELRLERLGARLAQTREAAEEARTQYQRFTRTTFRAYWRQLRDEAAKLDFDVRGTLHGRDDGRFECDVRVGVGAKAPVHHDSEDLSGGQKAALSILMGMTAVAFESESAGFFLIDEPFSASDVNKINELGRFLEQTGAQYLLSMPTSSDLEHCGDWLKAVWICTKTPGGHDDAGNPRLAPPVRVNVAHGGRRG